MAESKSTFLRTLMTSLRKAMFVESHPEIDTETLVEMSNADLPTRRKFLADLTKTVGLLGASTLLPIGVFATAAERENDEWLDLHLPKHLHEGKKIAIIGAGMAGLNCAYQLKKKGIKSQIYEASNRTGGRIYSVRNVFAPGVSTEFGAEFIDTNHCDMRSLAKEFKLELMDTHKDNTLAKELFHFDDKNYTEKDVIEDFRKAAAAQIKNDVALCGKNLDQARFTELDNKSVEQYIRELKCSKWLQDLLITTYSAEYGLDASEQSSLNFVLVIGTDTKHGFEVFGESDERFKVKGGNSSIPEALTENLKDSISMGYKLTSIKKEGDKYNLSFENKENVVADYVVMTIPFPVLRDISMDIGMSKEKKQCIDEFVFGQNNKLMFGFKNHFWREKYKSAGFAVDSIVQNGWDNSQIQNKDNEASGYTVFLGGKVSLEAANAAKEAGMRDSVPEKVVQYYLDRINVLFPGIKEQYNGINKAALWSNNPYSKGSYSCYKVGQWTSISGKEIEPVGNVFFAGEHCSAKFQGFMNGAAETGRQAAKNIVTTMAKK